VVCRKFRHTTQHGAIKGKTQEKSVKYYNLDVIISVGYRVNSKRGTQFRQWATQRLKDFLVKGVAINQKRLDELQQTVQLIQKSIGEETNLTEAKGLLNIITQYTRSFVLLNQYDSNTIEQKEVSENITYEIKYDEAKTAIAELKKLLKKKKKQPTYLATKKTKVLKEHYKVLCKPLAASISTQALKNKRHTCYILSSKIIRSQMAINASAPFCLSGSWIRINTGSKKWRIKDK
jgi:hypothetical protein